MVEKFQMTKAIGLLLAARRMELNLSQREIAERLGYRNVNFISMLENNRSSIPLSKVAEVVEAYELSPALTLALVKHIYPDCYGLIVKLLESKRRMNPSKSEGLLEKLLNEYKIDLEKL